MNKKVRANIFVVFLTLFIISVTIFAAKAAPEIVLTPTSGEPGDPVEVEGTGFAASKTVGIGWGPPIEVTDESVTVTEIGTATKTYSGITANHPIKPGSFKWDVNQGGVHILYSDNGNGTFSPPTGIEYFITGVINYTTGFFSRTQSSVVDFVYLGNSVNYTTYYFNSINSTFPILPTDGSGAISGQLVVPQIWNGSESVWVIDEAGNVGTGDFTVEGSDVIPEPLTVGTIVLLSSIAGMVSFYWLRKKKYPKNMV